MFTIDFTLGGYMSHMDPQVDGWEETQTTASVEFVRQAVKYLETCKDDKSIQKLELLIQTIKAGKLRATGTVSIKDALAFAPEDLFWRRTR